MLPFLKKGTLPGLTGIGLQPEGVCLVRVERAGGKPPAVTLFDFQLWEGAEHEKVLARLATQHDLKRARCVTVLDPNEYSLLLTEAPNVAPDELRAALRWRVKDLIDFHINDATLDVFDLPGDKTAGRARSMYAVAARSAAIQKRVNLMDAAGINLDVIDIPEMAQRNVAALLPEDVKGVVLVSFTPGGGLITITKQTEIYLSRNIEIGLDMLSQGGDTVELFDRVVLEVQRSLDYFDSHFRQAPIGHLALAPMPKEIPGLVEHLKNNLSLTVSTVDLMQLVQCRQEVSSALQSLCLNTLGAALRQEEKAL